MLLITISNLNKDCFLPIPGPRKKANHHRKVRARIVQKKNEQN